MNILDGIDAKLATWLLAQPVFFVASAPLSGDGHVNVSPKGMAGTFAVLGQYRVAYLDYYGSGAETIAHLKENGRITLMFAAFEGRPNIVRLFGRGRVVLAGDDEFAVLRSEFSKERVTAQRSIIVVELDRVHDSCGYSVPLMDFVADRTVLDLRQEKRGDAVYATYADTKNAKSIDGLPALKEN
ncbi:MAG: pyridoxamine 5'-phosphate oxidase family protein [Actinomycetota bacterium]|nr:pyridoxamine 5'-phosphate oxidase family protein [Actinomycetota bacterium]MDQ2955810.1 pyridoxamine 5'-phosphate oxidase family protein [Actinomycetota bacterium]